MRHLSSDELIDLSEGTLARTRAGHVETCGTCRARLADLRAMRAAASDADVPEPSPLFWDHFTARVRDAVAAEPEPAAPSWWSRWLPLRPSFALGAAALLIVAAGAVWLNAPRVAETPARVASAPPGPIDPGTDVFLSLEDDPAWTVVAGLTGQIDWETAQEAGIVVRPGSVEGAVWMLSDAERRELARLLKSELGAGG